MTPIVSRPAAIPGPRIDRRRALALGLGAAGLAALGPRGAQALDAEAARAHVRAAIDDVLALVRTEASTAEKADRLRKLLDEYAALPQIARFSAGRAWREMSGSQQERYTDAFAHYISTVYARRFQEYSGEQVAIRGVTDGGKRGLLVETEVTQTGGDPVRVDWLVSDRPGRVVIADIVIEGVSMLVTQREEVGAMIEARSGNFDRLISDLAAA